MQLQQAFIEWMKETYHGSKQIFLGGANKENITTCYKIENSITTTEARLTCTHEEADDRLMYHITHAVRVACFRRVIVVSPDTDVFTNLVHHFTRWQFSDLEELWVLKGNKTEYTATPIHILVSHYDSEVIDVLPAVHALIGNSFSFQFWTGCDTTSKVGTKKTALMPLASGAELLMSFGKTELSDVDISNAEEFLVRCLSKTSHAKTFDDLRY